MTDEHLPDDDEIASAVIDGEATAQEVAAVDRDPVLAARVAELRLVADAVAIPVEPLPAGIVDDLVGAALATATGTVAVDEPADRSRGTEPSGVVTDLAERRSAHRAGRWLAAAAVVLVALALPLALALRPEPQGDTFASVGSAANDDDAGDASAAPEAERDEALAAEEGAGADRSLEVEATADAAPSTTMSSAPPAPGVAGAAEARGVRWLGELGLLVDTGDGVAVAAAVALREPLASTSPTTVAPTAFEASNVWYDALRCTQEQVPGGVLEGLAFAGVEVPGDVRVLVVRPPDGSGPVVLVVDGVSPSTADAPLACGTVLGVAPLAG